MLRLICLIIIAFLWSNCNSQGTSNRLIDKEKENFSSSWDSSSNPLYWKFYSPHNPVMYMPKFSLVEADTSPINISFFDTIPETISPKMGEFYSFDTSNLADNKYIFLTTLTKYAVIRVNNRDVYLDKKYNKCVSINRQTYKDVYEGNGFIAVITHQIVDMNNGVSRETGTLEISNSKYQVKYKIHGGYRIP